MRMVLDRGFHGLRRAFQRRQIDAIILRDENRRKSAIHQRAASNTATSECLALVKIRIFQGKSGDRIFHLLLIVGNPQLIHFTWFPWSSRSQSIAPVSKYFVAPPS